MSSALTYGLSSIKGVGTNAAKAIKEGRPYLSIDDFLRRIDLRKVNTGTLDSLCKVGCFDRLYPHRCSLVAAMPRLIELAGELRSSSTSGQLALYPTPLEPSSGGVESRQQYRDWEKELLGIELSEDRVRVILPRVLSPDEWRWVWQVLATNPGNSEAEVSYLTWNVPVVGGVKLDDPLRRALEALGLTLEIR